ncbi:MAG: hypothetical protein ACJA0P_002930 [Planctomycetota bacterium]|jgi:hypothetical protein
MITQYLPRSIRSAALLLSLATTAYAQLPSAEIVAVGEVFATAPGVLRNFTELSAGVDTGWISGAIVNDSAGTPEAVLYGEFSSADPAGPRILRRPQVLAGIDQRRLLAPSLANGRLAYLSQTTVSATTRAAWLEDQLLTQVGAPAYNFSNPWVQLEGVIHTLPGDVVVHGRVAPAPSGPRTWVRYPAGQVVLQEGQAVPGTPESIGHVHSFDLSAQGEHHVAHVTLSPSDDEAILLNGEIYTFSNGSQAREGELVGFNIVTVSPIGLLWEGFDSPQVNSHGTVVFTADYGYGTPDFASAFRNGRPLPPASNPVAPIDVIDLDERGFTLNANSFGTLPSVTFERERLAYSDFEVDFDGDGLADPGYRITPAISWGEPAVVSGAGAVYGAANLRINGNTGSFQAVIRATFVQEGSQYCPGEDNTTGRPARLAAVGSDVAAFNRMKLVATGLPSGTIALPLFSLTPGNGVQPPGSVGTLCLAGSIGRGYYSLIRSLSHDTGSSDVYLNAIPQPSGPQTVLPGETWYAQLWYRDSVGPTAVSNFSDAITIRFR